MKALGGTQEPFDILIMKKERKNMFVVIEKRKEKRRPPKDDWIIKDPVLENYEDDSWWFMVTGSKIMRSPEWKLVIKLRHTFRENGKVKGKSVQAMTISYWEFVRQWIDTQIHGHEDDDFYFSDEKLFSAFDKLSGYFDTDKDFETLTKELTEKLRP